MVRISFIAASALLSLAAVAVAQEGRYEREREVEHARHMLRGRVVSVVDGDTFVIQDREGHRRRVCMYGVDAPEHGQAYWAEAKQCLERQVLNQEIQYEPVQVDAEGRNCVRVYTGDRGDRYVNLDLVRRGFGWHHTDRERVREFADAEREARSHHVGLWADREPIEPWKYRRDHHINEARRDINDVRHNLDDARHDERRIEERRDEEYRDRD
jgi:micrococcal nuclease